MLKKFKRCIKEKMAHKSFTIVSLLSMLINCLQLAYGQQVHLSLGSTTITTNNTEILITDIGEDADIRPSLTCNTDLTECCRSIDTEDGVAAGEWYYPDGSLVMRNADAFNDPFYRVRNAHQVVRLARRISHSPLSPTGSYCCVIPTTGGEMTFCANIVVCPSLILTNGIISYSDPTLGLGTVAIHSCNARYIHGGSYTRTCESNGRWSGSAGFCEVFCPPLPTIANGDLSYTQEAATYTCNQGYRLVGESMLTCQSNRRWSSQVPVCRVASLCPSLPHLPNGVISYNQKSSNGSYIEDTVATYSCSHGHVLIGVDSSTCQADRTWLPSMPYCAKQAMAQLRFGPTDYCRHWSEDMVSIFRRAMGKAVQEAVLTVGNHTLPIEHISEGVFSCYGNKNHTTFRVTITGTDVVSADEAVFQVQKWVESEAAVQVLWYLVFIDEHCPVSISSLGERECGRDEELQRYVDVCVARRRGNEQK